jgi:Astacin (Peptidase family M12A)
MRVLEKYTCIRFPVRTNEKDYVRITSGGGCYSSLGRQGGQQTISLMKNGCLSRGTIQHEIIHALGYDHMQNHPERDKFVTIMWANVMPSTRRNFERGNPGQFSNFGTTYDYLSVMHYNPYAFAVNSKKPTIVPKNSAYANKIGQRVSVTYDDVRRLNRMYECKNVVYI